MCAIHMASLMGCIEQTTKHDTRSCYSIVCTKYLSTVFLWTQNAKFVAKPYEPTQSNPIANALSFL